MQIPESGQLVQVRSRRWIVGSVQSSGIADPYTTRLLTGHLVRLFSVDEDSLSEELEVAWEIEPDAQIVEHEGLPSITGYDQAGKIDSFLDAVRWGAATNADHKVLQAPFRSGASIEDYQLDPVVRAIDMVRVNLLIADDTGLGKTIETGLVMQEMILRHRARTVLIICPASLQIKWQSEMREKFGLDFRIVDGKYLSEIRRQRGISTNPWTSFPRLITSMDWVKAGEGLRLLKSILPHSKLPRKFDILVVDEAHNVAPSGRGNYATDSKRTSLIRSITPHFEHRIFLSATPHNGYPESFTALLELLDDQRFSRNVEPNPQQLERVMVRRLKSGLVDKQGNKIHPERKLLPLEVPYTAEEQEVHSDLAKYIESRIKSTKEEGGFAVHFVLKLLKKRFFSSPRAFAKTLAVHMSTLGTHREIAGQKVENGILRQAISRLEEDYASDADTEEAIEEVVSSASTFVPPATKDQAILLSRMQQWAEKAKNRPDSKAGAIIKWLENTLRPNGVWNNERVILFTEYRDTHSWLKEILVANRFGSERVMELHGSLFPEDREKVKAAFQADPTVSSVRILLATDAASEGIDLQNWCNKLIHIEIPWNPNVLEQRNGRVDRHGQKQKEVLVYHPVGVGGSGQSSIDDTEFLFRAAEKVQSIRNDLGSVGQVLVKRIENAMLGKDRSLSTTDAESIQKQKKGSIAFEKNLQAKIEALHKNLMDSQEMFGLSPERILNAVNLALEIDDQPPLIQTASKGIFEVPILTGAWGRASVGLDHPFTEDRRPITFDHLLAKNRDDVILGHLEHDLVQLSLRLLRSEVWSLESNKKLHRVAFRTVAGLDTPIAAVWSRLLMIGGDHRRLHEELFLTCIDLGSDKAKLKQGKSKELLEMVRSSTPVTPKDSAFDVIKERFSKATPEINKFIKSISDGRAIKLKKKLDSRSAAELKEIFSVLDVLEQSLNDELNREEPEMSRLILTTLEEEAKEREQRRRDRDALLERLKRIPQERTLEEQSIQLRYSNVTERAFPIAVVFLVPERMTEA